MTENNSIFVSYQNINRIVSINQSNSVKVSAIKIIINNDKILSTVLQNKIYSLKSYNDKYSKYIDLDDDDIISSGAQIEINPVCTISC